MELHGPVAEGCGAGGQQMPPQTFGNRFLAEFRRLGGSTRDWPEQAVTVLDQAYCLTVHRRIDEGVIKCRFEAGDCRAHGGTGNAREANG